MFDPPNVRRGGVEGRKALLTAEGNVPRQRRRNPIFFVLLLCCLTCVCIFAVLGIIYFRRLDEHLDNVRDDLGACCLPPVLGDPNAATCSDGHGEMRCIRRGGIFQGIGTSCGHHACRGVVFTSSPTPSPTPTANLLSRCCCPASASSGGLPSCFSGVSQDTCQFQGLCITDDGGVGFGIWRQGVDCSTPCPIPTKPPSNPPVAAPSNPPVAAPSNPPVTAPSNPPVAAPSNPPVAAPSNPPVAAPSNPPVAAPSNPPPTAKPPTPAPPPLGRCCCPPGGACDGAGCCYPGVSAASCQREPCITDGGDPTPGFWTFGIDCSIPCQPPTPAPPTAPPPTPLPTPPPPVGSCCCDITMLGRRQCYDAIANSPISCSIFCSFRGGTSAVFGGSGTVCGSVGSCSATTRACCLGGACENVEPLTCNSAGGEVLPFSHCASTPPNACTSRGSCCCPTIQECFDGPQGVLSEAECDTKCIGLSGAMGFYGGLATTCGAASGCAPTYRGCCTGGVCKNVDPVTCVEAGGRSNPGDLNCASQTSTPCNQPGSCCCTFAGVQIWCLDGATTNVLDQKQCIAACEEATVNDYNAAAFGGVGTRCGEAGSCSPDTRRCCTGAGCRNTLPSTCTEAFQGVQLSSVATTRCASSACPGTFCCNIEICIDYGNLCSFQLYFGLCEFVSPENCRALSEQGGGIPGSAVVTHRDTCDPAEPGFECSLFLK
jgi:hypothetical protein